MSSRSILSLPRSPVVKCTRELPPSLGMEPTRRQPSNRRSARNGTHSRARSTARRLLIFGASVGQTRASTRIPSLQQGERESKECSELLTRRRSSRTSCWSPGAFRCVTSGSPRLWVPSRSTHGRRARDPEIRCDGHVPGALDEISKPVVVTLLRAGRDRHADDHRPSLTPAQLLRKSRAHVRQSAQ